MARTQVGFVYDPVTLKVLRIIIPDDDLQFVHHRLGPHEKMVKAPYHEGSSLSKAMEVVAREVGLDPLSAAQLGALDNHLS